MEELEQEYIQKAERRRRTNLAHAAAGVIFEDIDNAYIEEGVEIGSGAYIGPGVTLSGNTIIGKNCTIYQNSRIVDCKVGADAVIDQSVMKSSEVGVGTSVGPFAYIRPGCKIGDYVKIGDFVEVKNTTIAAGTKIAHLTYVGDADLGSNINIGCGVVFVNYDGKEKHRSTVGNDAFIGCNVNIISPINIEGNAYIAAGTTVTRDVPKGSLCVSRDKARVLDGWVEKRGLLAGRITENENKD
jgi:bifunctional UDP-N-acetylglucosamine pyrophosphorylase/glucosamine-1-phosphate N-acetyltransferase